VRVSETAKDLPIFLRGRLDTAAIPGAVRRASAIRQPRLPVFGAQVAERKYPHRFPCGDFDEDDRMFALTALLLQGWDLRSDIADVNERTHEIGVRLALARKRRSSANAAASDGL